MWHKWRAVVNNYQKIAHLQFKWQCNIWLNVFQLGNCSNFFKSKRFTWSVDVFLVNEKSPSSNSAEDCSKEKNNGYQFKLRRYDKIEVAYLCGKQVYQSFIYSYESQLDFTLWSWNSFFLFVSSVFAIVVTCTFILFNWIVLWLFKNFSWNISESYIFTRLKIFLTNIIIIILLVLRKTFLDSFVVVKLIFF